MRLNKIMSEPISEINPGLSEQEKERNYRSNLLHMTGEISKVVDTMHSVFGSSPIDTLPESVSRPVYNRLIEDIRKLEEVKEQLEKGNPNLRNENE